MMQRDREPHLAPPHVDGATADAAAPGKSTLAEPLADEALDLRAERTAIEPDEAAPAPAIAVHDTEATKHEITAHGAALPPHGGADELATGAAHDTPGGSGSTDAAPADLHAVLAAAETASAAYKAEVATRREQFDQEQQATTADALHTMSSAEKRSTLVDLGYDKTAVQQLKDTELDGLITGKLDAQQRQTKILGMEPHELAALSPARKLEFLVDLGIDRKDLEKAGAAKASKLFDDVMAVAHVPGQHQVKIKIKGGLLGKSWTVRVNVDADGNTDIKAQKEGGFLSKLWGWVKAAVPVILTVLAPLTAGATLVALAVYQTVTAIKTGDWLGAVLGAAGALAGVGAFAIARGALGAASTFGKLASVAEKVKNVASSAQAALVAAKAKSPGSLLAALAAGGAAFAGFASNAAGKFATTMKGWSDKLKQLSEIVSGGEKVVKGIASHDPLAAVRGAFEAAAAAVDAKSGTHASLQRAATVTGLVGAGKRALAASPPDYGAVAHAALGIATQLHHDRRIDDAGRIVAAAGRLQHAWAQRGGDPAALAEAVLGVAESLQLAKYDLDHAEIHDASAQPMSDAQRDAITAGYQRATRIVDAAGAALAAARTRPHPSYTAALAAATQLIVEFTADKRVDQAAVITAKLDAWTRAVQTKDSRTIFDAGVAFGEAIDGMRGAIEGERDRRKQEAETTIGVLPAAAPLPGAPDPAPPQELHASAEVTVTAGALPLPPLPIATELADLPTATPGGDTATHGPTAIESAPPANAPPTPTPAAPGAIDLAPIISSYIEELDAFVVAELPEGVIKAAMREGVELAKLIISLRRDGKTDGDQYEVAVNAMNTWAATHKLYRAVLSDLGALGPMFADPLHVAAPALQRLATFSKVVGRIGRFLDTASDICDGIDAVETLCSSDASVENRIAAGRRLLTLAATLPGDLEWAWNAARLVLAKLAPSAEPVIAIVRAAAARLGEKAAAVVMRYVTPILEKIVASPAGRTLAERVARDAARELVAWAGEIGADASAAAMRAATSSLAVRLGIVFRVASGPELMIMYEIGQLEMKCASEMFSEAYATFSAYLSSRLFGRTIEEIKSELRRKPQATDGQCNSFFRYMFDPHGDYWLRGAPSRIVGQWLPFAQARVHGIDPTTDRELATTANPVHVLEALPFDGLKMIAVEQLEQAASGFLDEQYRKEFGQDPP